jgi:hypothetical protein
MRYCGTESVTHVSVLAVLFLAQTVIENCRLFRSAYVSCFVYMFLYCFVHCFSFLYKAASFLFFTSLPTTRCATSRTVPGLIPGGVTGFFSDLSPSDRPMALGSTQPLVKMIKRNIPGGKGGRCMKLTISPPSRAECHGNWEPKPPGTFWAIPDLLLDSSLPTTATAWKPSCFQWIIYHIVSKVFVSATVYKADTQQLWGGSSYITRECKAHDNEHRLERVAETWAQCHLCQFFPFFRMHFTNYFVPLDVKRILLFNQTPIVNSVRQEVHLNFEESISTPR